MQIEFYFFIRQIVFIFNSTNTTDAASSARPNLTNYDVRVDLPSTAEEGPAPATPPLTAPPGNGSRHGYQETNWTVVVPERYVLSGYMQMGILIDGRGRSQLGLWLARACHLMNCTPLYTGGATSKGSLVKLISLGAWREWRPSIIEGHRLRKLFHPVSHHIPLLTPCWWNGIRALLTSWPLLVHPSRVHSNKNKSPWFVLFHIINP